MHGSIKTNKSRIVSIFTLLIVLACGAGVAAPVTMDRLAALAVPTEAGTVARGTLDAGKAWLRFDFDSTRLVVLELGGVDADTRLVLRKSDDVLWLGQSPSTLTFAVLRPTSVFVKLMADLSSVSRSYKLTSHLIDPAELGKDEGHEVDPDPFGKDEGHEVDPDPFAKDEGHEVDPDPFGKDEGHEVDPDPFGKLSTGQVAVLGRGCGREAADDHGDTFACAARLRFDRPVTGELVNGWGDDEDVFRFRIGKMRTVVLAATGDAAPSVALYDRFGQRLELAEGSGSIHITRTLTAGDYFVRVTGGSGGYEVSLR